jgi:galactokinase
MKRSNDDLSGISGSTRRELLEGSFTERYGGRPEAWVRAPGRVELLGTDTDDAEGYVLTMAIDRDTWIAFGRRDPGPAGAPGRGVLYSLNLDSEIAFEVPRPRVAGFGTETGADAGPSGAAAVVLPDGLESWGSYVFGVLDLVAREGFEVPGFAAVVHSTVPIGGGLSSSASLELAVLMMVQHLGGFVLSPVQGALLCQKAENLYAKVNCGILDQYSSAFGVEGGSILLDCRSLSHIGVPIPEDIAIVVGNTNVARALADSEYGTWKEQCLAAARAIGARLPKVRTLRDLSPGEFANVEDLLSDPVVRRRARFIVEENLRGLEMTLALVQDDRPAIRELTAASFAGMRDLYGKTVPEMEAMFDAMSSAPGVVGCRQSGGGFGGCLVAYVDRESIDDFSVAVAASYQEKTGIEATVFDTTSASGAGPLEHLL